MSAVAAIGALLDVGGFRLAGAHVYGAETDEAVRDAWHRLPDSVGLVILSARAASALAHERHERASTLTVVMSP